jgi:glycosyltransferase involved in cell wall biosynthesis
VESTPEGRRYFEELVEPAVDGRHVVHVENMHGEEKSRLLCRATALLAPIQWDEPFGLSVVEAMVGGTPAISLARGAAPELVEDGVTGWCVEDVEAMVEAVGRVGEIDHRRCAERARERFGPAAMADGYLRAYAAAAGEPSVAWQGEPGSRGVDDLEGSAGALDAQVG